MVVARHPIDRKYRKLGAAHGFLGEPKGGRIANLRDGGAGQHYERGSIYWAGHGKAYEVHGLIRDKWAALGWERSFLGYPTSDERPTADRRGRYSEFEHGMIVAHPVSGVHEVHGAIYTKWKQLGGEKGRLGRPISDEEPTPSGDGRRSRFEHGTLEWTPQRGAYLTGGGSTESTSARGETARRSEGHRAATSSVRGRRPRQPEGGRTATVSVRGRGGTVSVRRPEPRREVALPFRVSRSPVRPAPPPAARSTVTLTVVPVVDWEQVYRIDVRVRYFGVEGGVKREELTFRPGARSRNLVMSMPSDSGLRYEVETRIHKHDGQIVSSGRIMKTGNQTLEVGGGHRPPARPTSDKVVLSLVPNVDWEMVARIEIEARFVVDRREATKDLAVIEAGSAPSLVELELPAAADRRYQTRMTFALADGETLTTDWQAQRNNAVLSLELPRPRQLRFESAGDWVGIESVRLVLAPWSDNETEPQVLQPLHGPGRTIEWALHDEMGSLLYVDQMTIARDGTWWSSNWLAVPLVGDGRVEVEPRPRPTAELGSTVEVTTELVENGRSRGAPIPFGKEIVSMDDPRNAIVEALLGRRPGDDFELDLIPGAFGTEPPDPATAIAVSRYDLGAEPYVGMPVDIPDDSDVRTMFVIGLEGDRAMLHEHHPLAGRSGYLRGRIVGVVEPAVG